MTMPQLYALDCEFDGFNGRLLSVALFNRQRSFYARLYEENPTYTPWVAEHVAPLLMTHVPESVGVDNPQLDKNHLFVTSLSKDLAGITEALENFLVGKNGPGKPVRIHTDWPDDVKYFSELLLTGPGTMINIPGIEFKVNRVDSYPTTLVKGAKQHHAWWDAFVLFEHLNEQARQNYAKEREPFPIGKIPSNLFF
jgi:hypothetical protein